MRHKGYVRFVMRGCHCEIYTDENSNEQWDTGHGDITTRDSARLRYDADPESSVV